MPFVRSHVVPSIAQPPLEGSSSCSKDSSTKRMTPCWSELSIWLYGSLPIGSMYVIYGNIYHQYTPFMLPYIPAPWILWVMDLSGLHMLVPQSRSPCPMLALSIHRLLSKTLNKRTQSKPKPLHRTLPMYNSALRISQNQHPKTKNKGNTSNKHSLPQNLTVKSNSNLPISSNI